jgi:hypothetical protein
MTVLAACLALFAAIQLGWALRISSAIPTVDALDAPAPARWPTVAVVVPARDEAAGIEAALTSKLACGYPALELVAVDDRSRDATGAILDRLAATDPRLRVTHVRALADGWLGKLHAMAQGVAVATGEWVLFSDADVHLAPGTLERLIAHAEAHRVDGLAVMPRFDPVSPLLDSAMAGAVRALCLLGRLWVANDDRAPTAMGVGAFNLVRRRWLEDTDALHALRMEVVDDVALMALLKARGARTRVFAGRARVHLVFMGSVRAMAASTAKAGGTFGFGLGLAVLGAAAPLVVDLALPLAAVLRGGVAAALGGLALLTTTATHLVLCVHFAAPLRGALLWPLATPLLGALTLRAGVRAWREQGVWWRETFYPRAALEAGRRLDVRTLRLVEPPTPPG